MKVKYKGKWYNVAMTQYEYETGLTWYEIYDHSDTEQEHTEWITHPEVVNDDEDDADDKQEDDVINFEFENEEVESEVRKHMDMLDEKLSNKDLTLKEIGECFHEFANIMKTFKQTKI